MRQSMLACLARSTTLRPTEKLSAESEKCPARRAHWKVTRGEYKDIAEHGLHVLAHLPDVFASPEQIVIHAIVTRSAKEDV
jgi:hypothetical protein